MIAISFFHSSPKVYKPELDLQSTAGDDPYSVVWHMIVDIGSEENTSISEIVRLRPVFGGSFFKNKNQSWTQVIKLAEVNLNQIK